MARKPQESNPRSGILRVSQLNQRGPTGVSIRPDAAARKVIADRLELVTLPHLLMEGRIVPAEAGSFRFTGRLVADAVQSCGATLAPVRTRLDEAVSRRWSPHVGDPGTEAGIEGEEVEMGDDELEPLGNTIDLGELAIEELSLALPPWPRAEDAGTENRTGWTDRQADAASASPDRAAETGETRRPFAGLDALLRDKG